MSAIYQRARPVRWEDIVGQEHVKGVLRSALEQGRVGHAYLFSGPRGVGKTTTARLIAMTANCQAAGPKPCGECESCLSVRAGNHPDVMEIDAASNNGVDDVRDLREKIGLAAMRGGKKIYILDEAHMMTKAAFNALLKTLEEPPEHVIFILATTEPEKIIPTILSRCQHYRFRRLSAEEIASKLSTLVTQEGAEAEAEALHLMGQLADGAMRDGESLLERMLAAGKHITRLAVEEALGLPPHERVWDIASALVQNDAGKALSGAAKLYQDGYAARTVVEGLVSALSVALHGELGLKGGAESINGQAKRLPQASVPRLLRLQAALDEQDSRFLRSADGLSLELALTHALLAADAAGAGANAAPSLPPAASAERLQQRLEQLEKEVQALRQRPAVLAPSGPSSAGPSTFSPSTSGHAVTTPTALPAAPITGNWKDVIQKADIQMRAFLRPVRTEIGPQHVHLIYGDNAAFHARSIISKFDQLAPIVLSVFGPVVLEVSGPQNLHKRQQLGGGGAVPTPPPPATPAPRPAAAVPAPAPQAAPPTTPPITPPTTQGIQHRPSSKPSSARGPTFEPLPTRPAAQAPTSTPASTTSAPSKPAPSAPKSAPQLISQQPTVTDRQPITEEPDWDMIGSPYMDGDQLALQPQSIEDVLQDAPFGDYVIVRPSVPTSGRPEEQALPQPTEAPPAQTPTMQAPAPTNANAVADIRAHPLYDQVKARFSGRVREIGKNRRKPAPALAKEDASDEEEKD